MRQKEAIVFLEKCSIYNLRPKFLRFRLYKAGLTDSAAACKFRRTLLLKEIKFHKGKIKAAQHDMTLRIQEVRNKVSSFTAILVNRFLQREKKKENTVQLNLRKKLKNLGLVETSPVDVVHNLSSRILTEAESKLLNKELDFSLYPSRLDVQQIRAEFENLYSKIRILLSTSQCLILKQKLIRL